MDYKIHQHRLKQVTQRFNVMVVIAIGLLVSNILMVFLVGYATLHQRLEITPFFGNSHYIKSDSLVDTQYLMLMSENFIYARLNVTPFTVKNNHQRLLSFINSQHFALFTKQLEQESQLIIRKKISSHFEIQAIKINNKNLTCEIQGVLKRSVGQRMLPPKSLTYILKYHYHLGQLSIIQFTKEESHEAH